MAVCDIIFCSMCGASYVNLFSQVYCSGNSELFATAIFRERPYLQLWSARCQSMCDHHHTDSLAVLTAQILVVVQPSQPLHHRVLFLKVCLYEGYTASSIIPLEGIGNLCCHV